MPSDYYEEIVFTVDDEQSHGSDIELDGREPSGSERRRAQQLVTFLQGIAPRLGDTAQEAQALYEVGQIQAQLLGDPDASLESSRAAFDIQPKVLHIVRGYRKAATRSGSRDDLKRALRAEVRGTSSAAYCAPLRVALGRLQETDDGIEAAQVAYQLALGDDPSCIEALQTLERIARGREDWPEAAEYAESLAKVVADPSLRSELYSLTARHFDRAGKYTEGISRAARAMIDVPDSPSATFALERIACKESMTSELLWLRRSQIDTGVVDPSMAWFDLGVVARYLDDLHELARQAFVSALDLTIPDSASRLVTLGELASLLRKEEEWEGYASVEQERAMLETELPARAAAWHRVGLAREYHLGDDDGAIQAYERSLSEDKSYTPSLDGLGRVLRRQGRVLRFLEYESRYAPTRVERILALRRGGEIRIQDEATLDAGIEALTRALAEVPGDLTTLSALEYGLGRREAWAELLDVYEQQLELAEGDALRSLLLSRLSVVAERLGDRRRAIDALRRAADLGPKKVPESLARLAAVLQQEGELVEMVDVLERLSQLVNDEPEKTSLKEHLAAELERRGHRQDALKLYVEGSESAPLGHTFVLAGLSAFYAAERYEDIATCYERCASSGLPRERALWLCRAAEIFARHLDDQERSRELHLEALGHDPKCRPALDALEDQLIEAELWAELNQILKAREHTASNLLRSAMLSETLGDYDEATDSYGRARSAGSMFAALPLVRCLEGEERWSDLVTLFNDDDRSGFSQAHASYRLAEIAAERLGDVQKAQAFFDVLRRSEPYSFAPMTVLLGMVEEREARLMLLRDLSKVTTDTAVQTACLSEASDLLESLGHVDEALEVRRRLFADNPSNPVVEVAVELALEERRDRKGLVEVMKAALDDSQLMEELRSTFEAELGQHLAELGALPEAVEVLKESTRNEVGIQSLVTRITLTRLSRAIGDGASYFAYLNALSSCLPLGPERALIERLGELGPDDGSSKEDSIEGLTAALAADPLDYVALEALDDTDCPSEEILDHLRRAFERETDTSKLVVIGATLCARLLREDRRRLARWVLERLIKVAPDDLNAHILAAEVHRRDKAWLKVAKSLEQIIEHEAADTSLRLKAMGSLVAVHGVGLRNREGAIKVVDRLKAISPKDRDTLEVLFQAQELIDNAPGAASCLVELTENGEVEVDERAAFLARLAWIQAHKLNNEAAALKTVERIEAGPLRGKAVCSFFELVERSHRWELVVEGLLYVVGNIELDRSEEIETRARLAALLEGPLDRQEEAKSHYQRIVELDPSNAVARERVAELSPPNDPEQAVEMRRTLLESNPTRAQSYRSLRALALENNREDLAFCSEAVLEGMSWANEEETYFYQQRRTGQSSLLGCPSMDSEGLHAICPEFDEPSLAVLRAIDGALSTVFPVDAGAYGIASDEEPVDRELQVVASAAAQVFDIPNITLVLVSPRQVPTIELGSPRLLVLPRTIVDCTPREKSFVCGALLSRAAIGAVLGDPGRKGWATDLQIEYALWAACEVVMDKECAPFEQTAVFRDIKRHLSKAIVSEDTEALSVAVEHMIDGGPHPTGAELRAIMARASARAGMVAAVDPAVALSCLRTWRSMFATTDEEGWPDVAARAALSFSVSSGHLRVRQRMGLEVR